MADFLHRLLVTPLRVVNAAIRRVSAATHVFQYKVEGALRPSAEWFDHQLDAQWQWPRKGRGGFVERGVMSSLVLRADGALLELCCGDGFNSRHFYGPRVRSVVAVDANPEALRHAQRFNPAANVSYRYCDIRRSLPDGPFDNVVWDTAIHHFSREDAEAILRRISSVLVADGALSGHTVIEPTANYAFAMQTFTDPEDLARLLGSVFPYVCVRTTPDPVRLNLYFFAGMTPRALPFASERDDVTLLAPVS